MARGTVGEGATHGELPQEPWRPWLPAVLAGAAPPPEVRCLFGVALGLAAAPHLLRGPDVARRAQRWWQAVATTGPATDVERTHGSRLRNALAVASDAEPPADQRATADRLDSPLLPSSTATVPQEDADERRQPSPPSSLPRSFSLTDEPVEEDDGEKRFRVGMEGWVGERAAAAFSAAGESAAGGTARAGREPATEAPAPADGEPALSKADERGEAGGEPDGEATPVETAAAEPVPAGDQVIETRLGGMLYLIHVLLDLGLPEAFERGWRLASTAGPWGTLELLARGLLGVTSARSAVVRQRSMLRQPPHVSHRATPRPDPSLTLRMTGEGDGRFPGRRPWMSGPLCSEPLRSEPLRRDPLWSDPLWKVLAELAAWPASATLLPVRSLPPYRIPRGWLARLADPCASFHWSAAAGRLRVWSAAGYLLADVRRSAEPPSRQARRELLRIAGRRADAALLARAPAAAAPLARGLPPLPPGCPPLLGRWLAAVLPAVRRRLLLALVTRRGGALARALAAPADGRRDPVARALAVAGRLHVTASHLDLVLPLAAARLPVRRAGLDRDPGWLPAFGRVVAFHFL
jgi:hypothetical protein